MRFLPFSPINLQTANATITSSAIDMSQIFKMSAQVIIGTGTATGSLQLQVSNDHSTGAQQFGNQTFTHWSNLGSAVAISGAGSTLIAQQDMCYKALRAVYTDSSSGLGTALVTVQILCLGI